MKNKVHTYIFLALLVLYIGLSVGLPTASSTLDRYNISQSQARLIYLSVALPISIVWLTAFYSFKRFKSYAAMVAGDKEGSGFKYIANGLMVLAFSLPVSSLISSIFTYFSSRNESLEPASVIIRNYFTISMQLLAFLLIGYGAMELIKTLRPKLGRPQPRFASILIIAVSSIFTWLIVSRTGRGASDTYHLPVWLVVLTVVIPYLITWYTGFIAAYRLSVYGKQVKGVVYKQMLHNLVLGIIFIIGLSIFQRIIITASERLSRLNVTPLLLIVYLLIALSMIGYGLVARGAKQLKKIEEV